ncbi:hypothetical protein FOIG_15355 [Fusarium odoratissimum NRRL 54006]|uniref:Uncharacterized protein n=2 Tax=Fusarium oxysporum species complex TaxID=171631 RepID=X0K317_FUSO5|nr:uncharacterized protein FOIG_15355 [Fusarium odoratissimum NRRL 54006]EXL91454.1 hypothetical protein FOIG_15355 [Fusarium odoratissimum NRRL 54006]TXC02436.1 hypothetical protein FocTR4_00014784 [Fusarium oxysporum f. sp. cubense]
MTEDTGHNDEARIASNSSPEKVTPTETWGSRGRQLHDPCLEPQGSTPRHI